MQYRRGQHHRLPTDDPLGHLRTGRRSMHVLEPWRQRVGYVDRRRQRWARVRYHDREYGDISWCYRWSNHPFLYRQVEDWRIAIGSVARLFSVTGSDVSAKSAAVLDITVPGGSDGSTSATTVNVTV